MGTSVIWMALGIAAVPLGALGFWLGYLVQQRLGRARMRDAETQARLLLEETRKEAELIRKTATVEAREEWIRAKGKFDQEMWDARHELERKEQGLGERETTLRRRTDETESRERELRQRENEEVAVAQAPHAKALRRQLVP